MTLSRWPPCRPHLHVVLSCLLLLRNPIARAWRSSLEASFISFFHLYPPYSLYFFFLAPGTLSHPPQSFFSLPQSDINDGMLHHPVPMHPIDAISHLDLTHTCMPIYPNAPTSPSSRPRARQVLDKIKRQASAFVKSPTRRLRSHSCTQAIPPKQTEKTRVPIPTVTFASTASVHSVSSGRARSVSCSCSGDDDDARSTVTSILQIDAPPGGDFAPYLPIASRLERANAALRAIDTTGFASRASASHKKLALTLPPLSDASMKRPVIPPSSPSPSERSNSTVSTTSPVTPVFPHHSHHDTHPYASAAVMSQRWSICSDEPDRNNDPFVKGKAQVVRRSLIQDNFLLACAAADDSPANDGASGRSPKNHSSVFRKKSTASLPPSKPPPSCPLPSPPLIAASQDSDCARPSLGESVVEGPAGDEEWTLYLGAPSKPLELSRVPSTPKKESARRRSGSSPSAPSSKQHLSPSDIPTQMQQGPQPRSRTISNLSTHSSATTRRIESGPAPNSPSGLNANGGEPFEDWTLSLPLLRKPKSSLCVDPSARANEMPVEAKTRKCKSFTEWTTSLSDGYEREQKRLRELERERERERKTSHVSLVSVSSARGSQRSVKVKRQLPIGPVSNSPSHFNATGTSNTNSTSLNLAPSKSTSSLRSCVSTVSVSTVSSSASYKENPPLSACAPVSPISPTGSALSSCANSTLTLPATMCSVSTSTSVSTLAKFPLPPSFSSKLLQRRQAAPPMPQPLLPACSFLSTSSSSSSATAAMTTYGIARDSTLSLSPGENLSIDADIASAPATTSCFPISSFTSSSRSSSSSVASRLRIKSRSKERKEKKPETFYVPPSTASSINSVSTISSVGTASSVKTISSTSTVVPNRTRTETLMHGVGKSEAARTGRSREALAAGHRSIRGARRDDVEDVGARSGRSSFESSIRDTEYDTCTEGSFLDVDSYSVREEMETESTVSGAYYSARSSLSL